ncbi:uncharacterized protein PV07_04151 [Cladophialophora immunda]|uniref:Xylanolytic transcriptional activator regulatory domain-containing protein n=1 Tax=Cladophialophora immunda TaxID=569365 RepID=A0A0D2CRP6_9EURO|nr:uncharacterized protein PV07_04151 [Cladophialophora immunda]KIW32620.1 hypothetical protein PV07_04151 [Cladophialophora immunda]OQV03607.1 Fungal specific transcription factor domain-containing protein [Cladophialophora immunda]
MSQQRRERMSSASWEPTSNNHRIFRTVSPRFHDGLLQLYWAHYGTVVPMVDRDLFERSKKTADGVFYSHFLHVSMLAMGHRFADQSEQEVQSTTTSPGQSTFHRECRHLLWQALDAPNMCDISAVLILSDLEFGLGNSSLGRRFVGMASQLVSDMVMAENCISSGQFHSEEARVQRQIVVACSLYDKNWAQLVHQSAFVKDPDPRSPPHERRIRSTEGHEPPLCNTLDAFDERVSIATGELQRLVGSIIELWLLAGDTHHLSAQLSTIYPTVATLNREMTTWYQNLPPDLQWTSSNQHLMPGSFFLLHQQYNAAIIRLHQPLSWGWAQSDRLEADGEMEQAHLKHLAAISQLACLNHAIQIARILAAKQSRFGQILALLPELQTVLTATSALMDGVVQAAENAQRDLALQNLKVILHSLDAMSNAPRPAQVMMTMIRSFLNRHEMSHHSNTSE